MALLCRTGVRRPRLLRQKRNLHPPPAQLLGSCPRPAGWQPGLTQTGLWHGGGGQGTRDSPVPASSDCATLCLWLPGEVDVDSHPQAAGRVPKQWVPLSMVLKHNPEPRSGLLLPPSGLVARFPSVKGGLGVAPGQTPSPSLDRFRQLLAPRSLELVCILSGGPLRSTDPKSLF